MMGRALREITRQCIRRGKDPSDIGEESEVYIPSSIEDCLEQALNFFGRGKNIAYASGDFFRLAESYLSYVIHYYELLDYYDDWFEALKEAYHVGTEIVHKYEYNLLLCLYEKYLGNALFLSNQYQRAFDCYANRYLTALEVRAFEQARTIEELSDKVGELPDNRSKRRCLSRTIDFWESRGLGSEDPAFRLCTDLLGVLG
jgi:hypothetical protein